MSMKFDVVQNVTTGKIVIVVADGTQWEISPGAAYSLAAALNRAADQASGGGQQAR